MNLQKRRTGGPNLKFWEDAQIIGLFDPIRHWLIDNCKDAIQNERLTNRSLSQLCLQILLVQDDNFGSLAKEPRGGFSLQYKLPLILFQNFKPGGSICHLIKAALNLKKERQWSHLPLQSTSNEVRQLELWTAMLNEVINMKLWQYPKIYFHSSLSPENVENLGTIVSRFGGEIVSSPTEATHVIYPPSTTSVAAKDEIRPVIRLDNAFLLHWRYSAISQQLWTYELPEDCNLSVEESTSPSPEGPWEVDSRWLINTDLYREWVPEEDYLVTDQIYAKERGLPSVNARKYFTVHQLINSTTSTSNSLKRQSSPSPALLQSAPSEKKRKESSKKSHNSKNKEVLQLKPLTVELERDPFLCLPEVTPANTVEVVDMDSPSAATMLQAYVKQLKSTGQNSKSDLLLLENNETKVKDETKCPVLFIPQRAAWYDHESVHPIEKEAFPQYFPKKSKKVNCSKPRQLYMACRNFMVDSYRCHPSKILSFNDCVRALPGCVSDLLSIYNFLNLWGLINVSDRVFNTTFEGDSLSSLSDSLLDLEVSPDDPTTLLIKKNCCRSGTHIVRLEDEPFEKDCKTSELDSEKLLTPRVKKSSNSCSGSSRSSNQSSTGHSWTDEETLFLLEAIELYGDDWNSIAGHVGRRTEDECIQQMLRLPIEDPYLTANPIVMNGSMGELGMPFARSGNPVMAMIAFLASTVSSKIVSSAAKAALRVYCNNLENIAQNQTTKSATTLSKDDPKPESVDTISQNNIETVTQNSTDAATKNDDKDAAESSTEVSTSNPKADDDNNTINDDTKLEEYDSQDLNNKEQECEENSSHKMEILDKENQAVDDVEHKRTEIDLTDSSEPPSATTEKEEPAAPKRLYASLEEDVDLTHKAVEAALKSAINKARDLASIEERKIRVLVMQLLNVQMNKIDIKMKELQQLDDVLAKEHNQILQQREQVVVDRNELRANLTQPEFKEPNDLVHQDTSTTES